MRKQLFSYSKPYDHEGSNERFLKAVKHSMEFHNTHCSSYRTILSHYGCSVDQINTINDLSKIPPIPTAYLKNHEMLSVNKRKLFLKSTSSGTTGKPVEVGFDKGAVFYGGWMIWQFYWKWKRKVFL